MQRRSSSSAGVKFHKLDYERVLEVLRRYAENLVSEGRARAVILVGSLAHGDYTAYSDADVIVVVDRAAERPIDRLAEYIDPTLPIDIKPRVYTRSEILRMAREGRRIVDEVLRYGKLLAGDRSVVEKLRRAYRGGTGESSS